jgi:hypothetical protein
MPLTMPIRLTMTWKLNIMILLLFRASVRSE